MKLKRIILELPEGKTIKSGKMENSTIAKVIEFYHEHYSGFTYEIEEV